jgi:predicted phage terminase large subunit-like protein
LVSPDPLILSKHIEYLCNELQRVGNAILNKQKLDEDYIIINIPPGMSKSTIVSILWPAWLITNDPSTFVLNSSYSAALAENFVRKSMLVLNSDAHVGIFGAIEYNKKTEYFFETIQAGGRISSGTGGAITGYHGNVIIIDDPLSVEMSYSKAERDRANRYITTTLPDRKRDKTKTPTILVMQRLHEEDPTGHLLELGLNIKHICLPAVGEGELYTDGLLDPKRLPLEELEKRKKLLGTYSYSGQYLQRPYPEEGGIIKAEWFEIQTELPNVTWDLWIDGAYTKNTDNDPTGFMVAGYGNNKLYIKHATDKHMEMPEVMKFTPEYCLLHNVSGLSRVFIEPKATGETLIQLLNNETKLNAVKIKSHLVSEGKTARVQTAAPKVNSGRVVLIKGNWNDSFIEQIKAFPNAKNDEYCDLIGYACDYYFNNLEGLYYQITDNQIQTLTPEGIEHIAVSNHFGVYTYLKIYVIDKFVYIHEEGTTTDTAELDKTGVLYTNDLKSKEIDIKQFRKISTKKIPHMFMPDHNRVVKYALEKVIINPECSDLIADLKNIKIGSKNEKMFHTESGIRKNGNYSNALDYFLLTNFEKHIR